MGRQLQVLMNGDDEKDFISFLRGTANIQIIESFAPSIEELWVDSINMSYVGHHSYDIWNKDFPWLPEYGTVGPRSHDPSHIGWSYISNKSTAPILEVSRSNPQSGIPGRLYWAKDFSAPEGLGYDTEAFSQWVEKIFRWVRKNGKKLAELPLQPYALPGALSQFSPNLAFKRDALKRAP